MVDLRKAARGQMCTVRIPGYCNHDPETSVLAHYRLAERAEQRQNHTICRRRLPVAHATI